MSRRPLTKKDLLKEIGVLKTENVALRRDLAIFRLWAEQIDKWHTELCGLLGVPAVHPAKLGTPNNTPHAEATEGRR